MKPPAALPSDQAGGSPRFPRLPQLAAALALPLVNLGGPRLALHTAPKSGLRYYVSLPQGWTPTRRWPLLVTIDGANHGFFLPHALAFMRARHTLPFIIVTPFVVSNTGRPDPSDYPYPAEVWQQVSELSALGFDAAGLLEAVAAVGETYGAEEQFFLTGWSAGGHLTWYMTFTYPDVLAATVPVCANFAGRGMETAAASRVPRPVPVRALQGENDRLRAVLDEQWARAYAAARARGYTDITRDLLTGVGHSACAVQVMDRCHALWRAQARDHREGNGS